MKWKIAAATLAALCTLSAQADQYTRGYVRKDGTVVQGHYSTSPNGTRLDNYSTQGNSNPYTGQQGTVSPYRQEQPWAQPRPQQNPWVVQQPAPNPRQF